VRRRIAALFSVKMSVSRLERAGVAPEIGVRMMHDLPPS
jgi:hypothetical protein